MSQNQHQLLGLDLDDLLTRTIPDCTEYFVFSGILKDYLRELPSQLITRTLYHVVREAMTLRPPPAPPATPDPQLAQSTVELLSCLPPPERVTQSSAVLLL